MIVKMAYAITKLVTAPVLSCESKNGGAVAGEEILSR